MSERTATLIGRILSLGESASRMLSIRALDLEGASRLLAERGQLIDSLAALPDARAAVAPGGPLESRYGEALSQTRSITARLASLQGER